jgi:hypothetical protein
LLLNASGGPGSLIIHPFLLLLIIVAYIGSYVFAPTGYALTEDGLLIQRIAKNVLIKYSDIAEVRLMPGNEILGGIRLFGVGGLFGYYGIFYNPEIGRYTAYATRANNRIFIQTKAGKKIVITPDDTSLANSLSEKISQEKAV